MPLTNFVVGTDRGPIRHGDLVFQITMDGISKIKRPIGHAGIARRDVDYSRGESVPVIHMTPKSVRAHDWKAMRTVSTAEAPNPPVVDVSGSPGTLDEVTRDTIVTTAATFDRKLSVLETNKEASCYWQGIPQDSGHPRYPGHPEMYAFTCSTFAHHCYRKTCELLVDLDEVPLASEKERGVLSAQGLKYPAEPFRRLSCAHLICAIEHAGPWPFTPADGDWQQCSDKVVFRRLLATTKIEEAPTT